MCVTWRVYFWLYIVQVVKSIVLFLPKHVTIVLIVESLYQLLKKCNTQKLSRMNKNCLIFMYSILMYVFQFFNVNNISLNCCKLIKVLNWTSVVIQKASLSTLKMINNIIYDILVFFLFFLWKCFTLLLYLIKTIFIHHIEAYQQILTAITPSKVERNSFIIS